ncbi:hypothetical protein ACFLYF_02405 [Chloroflexota bacterium]
MATDPSWLYSTIAQCSAAIVAIVGGFIIATVLMLTAEKRSLTNQLSKKKIRLEKLILERDTRDMSLNLAEELRLLDNRDIALLEGELSNLNSHIITFSYPPNLGWGLAVLGYLTVFCIFWPVLVIATEAFSTWQENLILYSFYFGIILIFAYIFNQIQALRRKIHARS